MGKEIKKFYAVKKGLKPGIYFSWNECKAQTHKFKGAIFKSFPTLKEAEDYLNSLTKKTILHNIIHQSQIYQIHLMHILMAPLISLLKYMDTVVL